MYNVHCTYLYVQKSSIQIVLYILLNSFKNLYYTLYCVETNNTCFINDYKLFSFAHFTGFKYTTYTKRTVVITYMRTRTTLVYYFLLGIPSK